MRAHAGCQQTLVSISPAIVHVKLSTWLPALVVETVVLLGFRGMLNAGCSGETGLVLIHSSS